MAKGDAEESLYVEQSSAGPDEPVFTTDHVVSLHNLLYAANGDRLVAYGEDVATSAMRPLGEQVPEIHGGHRLLAHHVESLPGR